MYYVVKPGGVIAWCARYQWAKIVFFTAVERWPDQNIGLFVGTNALHWHHGGKELWTCETLESWKSSRRHSASCPQGGLPLAFGAPPRASFRVFFLLIHLDCCGPGRAR